MKNSDNAAISRLKPRRLPRQERARMTVDAIFLATEQIVRKQGFGAVSTRAIAERAGVSIGSLYQYFPTSEAILLSWYEAVAANASQQIKAETMAILNQPLDEALAKTVGLLLDLYARHALVLLEMPRQVAPIEAAVRHSSFERLNRSSMMLYLSQHPEFDFGAANRHIFFIESIINGIIARYVLEQPDFVSRQAVIDEVCLVVAAYLDQKRN